MVFSYSFDRVCDEVKPSSEEEWLDCVGTNSDSKEQPPFTVRSEPLRNPRIPSDLVQDVPNIVTSDAVETSHS